MKASELSLVEDKIISSDPLSDFQIKEIAHTLYKHFKTLKASSVTTNELINDYIVKVNGPKTDHSHMIPALLNQHPDPALKLDASLINNFVDKSVKKVRSTEFEKTIEAIKHQRYPTSQSIESVIEHVVTSLNYLKKSDYHPSLDDARLFASIYNIDILVIMNGQSKLVTPYTKIGNYEVKKRDIACLVCSIQTKAGDVVVADNFRTVLQIKKTQ